MANMAYKLLVVESPTKAKTIGKYLGGEYKVLATVGHLRDLPSSKMGVDTENDFEPTYVVDKEKQSVVNDLRAQAEGASCVLLATDPDREGEAIAWHVKELMIKKDSDSEVAAGAKKKKKKAENFEPIDIDLIKRVTFHEITKSAIEEALKKPRQIDLDLVDAQQARRILDRLVGYQLSPILWRKVRRGLSAGRVQSVAVRLICEREVEIAKFVKRKFFRVLLKIGKGNLDFEAELVEFSNKKVEIKNKIELFDGEYTYGSTIFEEKERVEEAINSFGTEYKVEKVAEKEIGRHPLPPFTTSKLQQAAASKFGWSGKLTMSAAQKLYEKGWITYHRTDATYMSPQAVDSFRQYIGENFGKNYVPDKPRFYATKSKNAQEAHEAIRPTKVERLGDALKEPREKKLYELIWKRAVSSQAASARVAKTNIHLSNQKGLFRAEGLRVVFDGYLKIYGTQIEEQVLPQLAAGDLLEKGELVVNEHETSCPPRYSDASLVASLERQGIGRPSTYAPIISTILTRQYIEKNEGRFYPTALGVAVNGFVVKYFPKIVDLPFTAGMENELDRVANGKRSWRKMMADFWLDFKPTVDKVGKESERVAVAVEQTGRKCPDCGEGDLVIRMGRFGKFIACSRFPECKHTEQIKEVVDWKCPECGSEVVIRRSKKGRKFFGCSKYPTCKWAGWKKP